MNNKKINSHFIQKAFAKSWADERGIVKWLRQGTQIFGEFNIYNDNWKQPISKKGYYSIDIEKGMNLLENLGINLIKRMEISKKTIIMTRQEIIAFKYYLLLSDIRVSMHRKHIETRDADVFFNKIINKMNLTPKQIHEKQITLLINSFLRYYKNNESPFFSNIDKKMQEIIERGMKNNLDLKQVLNIIADESSIENIIQIHLNMALKGKLAFTNFESSNLLLFEVNSFQEISKQNKLLPLYSFYALSPELGTMIIYSHMLTKVVRQQQDETKIFDFSLNTKTEIEYQKEKEIDNAYNEFLVNESKGKPDLTDHDLQLLKMEFDYLYIVSLYSDEDKFTYKIHDEPLEVANICNAMRLVHNNEGIIIYSDIKHYNYSILTAEWLGIHKMEEINK